MACWLRGDHRGTANSSVSVTGHTDDDHVDQVEFTWNGCGLSNTDKQYMQGRQCTSTQTPTQPGQLRADLKFYRDGNTVVHTEGLDITIT